MPALTATAALSIAKGFIPKNWQQVINLVAIGGACLTLGFCKGEDSANAAHEAARALANVEALAIDAAAQNSAASERVTDALRIDQQEEELIDAISEIPDTVPDTVRVMLGCKRLRTQGTPEISLPAICGPKGGNYP